MASKRKFTDHKKMDYFAHGLWSYIIFHRRKHVLYAVMFGLLPDSLSFGVYTVYLLATRNFTPGPPDPAGIPDGIYTMYGLSHSLIIAGIAFFIACLVLKKIPYYMLAWPLAIIVDIFTHTRDYLPTPFLWPVSDWHFPGISWASKEFMIPNYLLIFALFVWIGWKRKKKNKN